MSLQTTHAPKYKQGDRVRIREDAPAKHHRTPWYIKGRTGVVSAFSGMFVNPETRAYGTDGLPKLPLYLVEFDQSDIWTGYDGPQSDKIYLDIFEHWLEPA